MNAIVTRDTGQRAVISARSERALCAKARPYAPCQIQLFVADNFHKPKVVYL